MNGSPQAVAHSRVEWERGACVWGPADAFHDPEREEEAKGLCGGCKIEEECRSYALVWEGGPSVWGGLNVKEREHARGRRYRDQRSKDERGGAT